MWVNENLIDVLATPTFVGQRATLNLRPMTATYTVTNHVTTVGAEQATNITVTEPTPGHLVATGQIAAHSSPTLRVWEVDHPSQFARTAFIEALQRAGVTVTAPATGTNPTALLPRKGTYSRSDLVGEHVSLPMSQYAKLILKVSYNRGADLMACLAAVKVGSINCEAGLGAEVKTATGLGVSRTGVFPQDGAGSDDQGRTTPSALATLLRGVATTAYGSVLFHAVPTLGRDGTLADVFPKSPAAGHAQIKTGNRVVATPSGVILVLGNSLAGYVHTRSGRRVVLMIAVGNVPTASTEAFLKVVNDQARMVIAIQQDL
jgi:D-alanyl-D-alanine carboxypeptidase/D-alanyl-D-alanine-endopeptidase (penicillin-binding protein 4)